MKKLSGNPIDSVLSYKKMKSAHPKITRIELVQISLVFLQAMRSLHNLGVLLVDLNPKNILLDLQTKKISIVDVDSAQVGKYCCEVGVDDYFSPILIKHRQSQISHLSTIQDEYFSISILIFQILMGFVHPYDFKGRTHNIHKNIEGYFAYVEDENKIPGKSFKPLWSKFSRQMKVMFKNIFKENILVKDNKYNLTKIETILRSYSGFIQNKKYPERKVIFFSQPS